MAAATQSAPRPAHELVYEPEKLPKLRSNYGAYLQDANVGWMRETPIDTPLSEMRKRFEEDGYVWVKNVMPREDVLDMRQSYFEHMAPTGILKPGTSPRDGIFDEREDPVAHNGVGGRDLPEAIERVNKLAEAHTQPFYLAFLEHPKLRQFVRDFMEWKNDVLVKRTMLRHNVPHGLSTGVHYDRLFLRAGEAEFLTAWVPIGDVAAVGGGLVYLEHSDDMGRQMEAEFMKKNMDLPPEERISGFNTNMARDGQLTHDIEAYTKELEHAQYTGRNTRKWLVGNYEAGDVVFHNPYLLHGAAKNEDPSGRIRLSTDLRFYEEGAPLDTRWMRRVWGPDDGFNDSYPSLSEPPPQSVYTPPATTGVGNGGLTKVSYSYEFTVTTATTAWGKPSFQTPAPVPNCSNDMCPSLDKKTCKDEMGKSYGVLCDTRFIGIVITTSGKHKREDEGRDLEEAALAASSLGEREVEGSLLEDRELDARTYTRTFNGCADYCDMFAVDSCLGFRFNAGFDGNCQALASITGSFRAIGEIAAVRL
ncbi:hypothetical protein Q7P37_010101 [Cladosporium fusiforme]